MPSENSSSLSSVFKSLSKTFRSPGSYNQPKTLPGSINPTVVGNAIIQSPEFAKTLKYGSTSEKITAITKLRDSIDNITVSSIPEVWFLVRSQVNPDVNENLRVETLKLMRSCIQLRDLSTPTKVMFYEDIVDNCQITEKAITDPCFESFLQCLVELTDNGRDVYDLLLYKHLPLSSYLIQLLSIMNSSYGGFSRKNFIKFLASCIKANYILFDGKDLAVILELTLEIANSTSNIDTLSACIKLCNNYIVYGSVPQNQLQNIILLIAGTSTLSDEKLHLDTVAVFDNMLQDKNISYLTLLNLCYIIEGKESRSMKGTLGSMAFFTYSLDYYNAEDRIGSVITKFFENTFGLVLESLECVLKLKDIESTVAVLNFLASVLKREIVKLRYLTNDETTSVWKLLKNLDLELESSEYKEAITAVFDNFETYYSNSLVRPHISTFFENLTLSQSSQPNLKSIMTYYLKSLRLLFVTPNWIDNCKDLIDKYYSIDANLVFQTLYKAYSDTLTITNDQEILQEYIDLMLKGKLLNAGESLATVVEFIQSLECDLFRATIQGIKQTIKQNFGKGQNLSKVMVLLTLTLAQSCSHSERVDYLLDVLLSIAKYALESAQYELFLIIARLLISVRQSIDSEQMFFVETYDVDGLCDTLGRNMDFIDDEKRKKELLETAKWVYPERDLKYFPIALIMNCNKDCIKNRRVMQQWLELCVDVLTEFYDWEAYSFILSHLCPQLSDSNLFLPESHHAITRLVEVISQQLQLNFPVILVFKGRQHQQHPKVNEDQKSSSVTEQEPTVPSGIFKADIQAALVRTLSGITPYKSILTKTEEDHLINSVIKALKSWNKTGIPCIHFLSVSCYEFPDSIRRFLNPLLNILQTRMTSPLTIIPILHFLSNLSEIPSLLANFTLDDFRRIFGIAFKYLAISNDLFEQNQKMVNMDYQDASIEKIPSTQSYEITKPLLLYITISTYNVILNWFLKLNLERRKSLSSFIIKGLINNGVENNYKNLAFVEFISRFTFSKVDLQSNIITDYSELEGDSNFISKSWVYGSSIMTFYTNKLSGYTEAFIRKATTVSQFTIKMPEESFPDWLVTLQGKHMDKHQEDELTVANENSMIFTPSYLFTELLYNTEIGKVPIRPVPLASSDLAIQRSLGNLDRIPIVNFFKVGVVYMGPNQIEEDEILSNQFGSEFYHQFLKELGNLIKLKNCKKYYVGGLDTVDDSDGEFTIHFQTEISQMCFHVITMMPNTEDDPTRSSKKRHIGNDYVNIYWNESGTPFETNKISSQFSFISIVIQPFVDGCYKVRCYRKSGIPGVFAISHFKIVHRSNLAKLIRMSCFSGCQFCYVWNDLNWEFNWERRYKQIELIKNKNDKVLESTHDKKSSESVQESVHISNFEGVVLINDDDYADDNDFYKQLEVNSFA